MLVKLNFDATGLNIPSASRTFPPDVGVSTSLPPETFLHLKRGKGKPFTGPPVRYMVVRSKNYKLDGRRTGLVAFDLESNKQSLTTNPGLLRTNYSRIGVRFTGNETRDPVKAGGIVMAEKMRTKRSKKWLSYGGFLPKILQVLHSVQDLDEALGPWSDMLNNKERTLILKEQSCWMRALEIFRWFERKGCYELNVIHYNIMLRILGKAHQWRYIQRLWDEMCAKKVRPINSTYGTLIDVYSKGGLKYQALCWLGKMSKQGIEADEVTMGIVVQMYKKSGEYQTAETYFKKWSLGGRLHQDESKFVFRNQAHSHVGLSSHSYNTLIDMYGKSGQLDEASETFWRMLKEGIVPTTVTFNTMIHIYGNNGRIHEVDSLINIMGELQCPADTRTYNTLISVHTKHNDIKTAFEYFTKMKEDKLEPDIVSYRILLYAFSIRNMVMESEELIHEMDKKGLEVDEYTQSALTRMYIVSGIVDKAWLWFQRFHLADNMNSSGYSANIDAFGEHGHVLEAEKVFDCCKKANKLTVVEFNVMIKAYGIGKRYEKACQLLDDMENHGVVPDKCSYNSLIQILTNADLPHRAQSYLRKMQESGLATDCVPFCAVISSFIKSCKLKDAEEVYTEMVKSGIEPDVIVYGVLINAYAEMGSVKEALTYLDTMKSKGLAENTVIYNSLIKLYTKVGCVKEAQETYRRLGFLKPGPDIYSSNCMINLYMDRSMVTQAEEIFKSLKQSGEANEFTFSMMLCMYKKIGMLEEATKIAGEMRKRGMLTQLLSFNNVIALYALDGKAKEALQVFEEMVDKCIQPDDSTFRSLGGILVRFGVPKRAVTKLYSTRKEGATALKAWLSMLSYIVGEDDHDNEEEEEEIM